MDTTDYVDGFYRVDADGEFQYAPNFVYGPTYTLLKIDKDLYTYPAEGGWYWFNTVAEAKTHFNIIDGVTP